MFGNGSQIIPYSELKFLEEIGTGAFGKVFVGGKWKKNKTLIVNDLK